jgi:hypothetical protein
MRLAEKLDWKGLMRKVLNSFIRTVGCASNFRLVAERPEIFSLFPAVIRVLQQDG